MRKIDAGGGWPAIRYTLSKAREVGGIWKLWKAMRSKNACKTCALGMGGQRGGMVNELGSFPEVCKKSLQAMAADMQGGIKPEFWSTYQITQLQRFTPRELESCGRLTQPVIHRQGENYYRPVSWDEALDRIVEQLKAVSADQTFWYFSGRSSNEAGFLLQLFARVYGTNNINNCSYYCHQASGVGLNNTLGTGTATIVLEDLEKTDLVFLIGGNPASNHPRLMSSLKNLRRRGGEVIVINPVVETGLVRFRVPSDPVSLLFGTKIATLYVQPHIGADLALLYGVAKRVLELGAIDAEFLDQHCDGWPDLRTQLESLDWSEIESRSGVAYKQIDEIARRYAKARSAVFAWTMGITHHAHGVQNVEAIGNLALMRGMVGRPHAGMMPIRGHSNVQGIGSVGVTPTLRKAIFDRLQSEFGMQLPTTPGLDTMACIEAADQGALRVGFCLGGNLYGASPDAQYVERALAKLDLLVYINTTLNTGHAYGLAKETIILPTLARDEEPEPTTQESMFNYVRLSDGGPRRHDGPRSEIEIISHIARRVLEGPGPVDWHALEHTRNIREMIAKVVPGFEQIARIDETRQEFQIGGRTFHQPRFPTPNGRAQMRVHALPPLVGEADELRLMTVRSEGQFNTVVYEDYDLYRNQQRRDVILLHPEDIRRLGLAADMRVDVFNQTGRMTGILVREFEEIRPGNALMYYPEANVLVPRSLDPTSKTPAYKGVPVRVVPSLTSMPESVVVAPSSLQPQHVAGDGSIHARQRSC